MSLVAGEDLTISPYDGARGDEKVKVTDFSPFVPQHLSHPPGKTRRLTLERENPEHTTDPLDLPRFGGGIGRAGDAAVEFKQYERGGEKLLTPSRKVLEEAFRPGPTPQVVY